MTDTASDRLREKAHETREKIVDMSHLAKEAVQDKYHELKDRASEKYDEGKEKVQEFEEALARQVRGAPMKSVLIAAGVGLVVGLLWRRG